MNESSFIWKVPKKTLQLICLLWAAWIFGSSCTVITAQQFVSTASSATRISHAKVATTWESYWWVFVKGYHVLEFTVLTLLLACAFDALKRQPLFAGAIALVYAALDEWHQTFVPHRGGHISDVMIDGIGIVLAIALLFWLGKRKAK